jgi:hypothetical protein
MVVKCPERRGDRTWSAFNKMLAPQFRLALQLNWSHIWKRLAGPASSSREANPIDAGHFSSQSEKYPTLAGPNPFTRAGLWEWYGCPNNSCNRKKGLTYETLTRNVSRLGSVASGMAIPAASPERRYSIIGSVSRSPGTTTGMPGG